MICSAGETAVLLIAEADREQRRLLELDLEVTFRPVLGLRQELGQPDHLEGSLPKVVRLLGIEQQNAVGDFDIRNNNGHDGPSAQMPESGESVVPIGCP